MLYQSKFKCHCTMCLNILLTELKYDTEFALMQQSVKYLVGKMNITLELL